MIKKIFGVIILLVSVAFTIVLVFPVSADEEESYIYTGAIHQKIKYLSNNLIVEEVVYSSESTWAIENLIFIDSPLVYKYTFYIGGEEESIVPYIYFNVGDFWTLKNIKIKYVDDDVYNLRGYYINLGYGYTYLLIRDKSQIEPNEKILITIELEKFYVVYSSLSAVSLKRYSIADGYLLDVFIEDVMSDDLFLAAWEQGYSSAHIDEQKAYNKGYNKGLSDSFEESGFDGLLSGLFTGIGTFLSIQLLPNISIGMIIAIPVVFGVIMFILGKRKSE